MHSPPHAEGGQKAARFMGKGQPGQARPYCPPTVLLWDIGTDLLLGTQEAISHGSR